MNIVARASMLALMLACFQAFLPGQVNSIASAAAMRSAVRAPEARSVWIWGSTVRSAGAEAVAEKLKQNGVTDAIMLVKGTAGTVGYPSAIAPAAAAADTLGEFIAACHARGIKVHAWLNYHQDDYFGITKTKKKYAIWHVAKYPAQPYSMADGRICPLRAEEEYNAYFLSIVREILQNYPVDGIHLDYIRYPHTVYCFCPAHQARAAAEGINLSRIRDLINETYYVPKDDKAYFNAFAAGDPDVTKWVGLRVSEVNRVVQAVRQAVDEHNELHGTRVLASAALMPEGALSHMVTDGARSDQFGLCHYAQSYRDIAGMTGFIAPMSYHKDYLKPPSWVGDVAAGAVAKAGATPVLGGVQTYSVTPQAIVDAISAARWNGAAGFALFRYGTTTSDAWTAVVPTLDKLVAAGQAAFDAGWIANAGVYNSLQSKLKNAKKSLENAESAAARNQIEAYLRELEAQSGNLIDARAARILSADGAWVLDLMP